MTIDEAAGVVRPQPAVRRAKTESGRVTRPLGDEAVRRPRDLRCDRLRQRRRRERRHVLDRRRPADVASLVLPVEDERGECAAHERDERGEDQEDTLHACSARRVAASPSTPSPPLTRTWSSAYGSPDGRASPSTVVVAASKPARRTSFSTSRLKRPDG